MEKIDGYFTVEASLVLPIVLGCILLAVYLGIYQYDRCTLEQRLNLSALLAVTADPEGNEERIRLAKRYMSGMDDRFLAWKQQELSFTIKKGKLQCEMKGEVQFPFHGLLYDQIKKVWVIKARSGGTILNPVSFVRNYKKIKGGLEDGNRIYQEYAQ